MGLLELFFGKREEKGAKVVPMPVRKFDKEQEHRDLAEKHSEFFTGVESPVQQMQSQIGENKSSHIEDVTPSRSEKFFQEAPSVNEGEDITALEEYMHVPVDQEEILSAVEQETENIAMEMQSQLK